MLAVVLVALLTLTLPACKDKNTPEPEKKDLLLGSWKNDANDEKTSLRTYIKFDAKGQGVVVRIETSKTEEGKSDKAIIAMTYERQGESLKILYTTEENKQQTLTFKVKKLDDKMLTLEHKTTEAGKETTEILNFERVPDTEVTVHLEAK